MRKILKKIIPRSYVVKVRRLLTVIDNALYPLFACTGFLSSLYYLVLSREFRREHYSVLQSRLAYKRSLNDIKISSALLRRNTHRLEKGLIMSPRRDSFAEGYILETVKHFEYCKHSEKISLDELKWANDVLRTYFSVVVRNAAIEKAYGLFEPMDVDNTTIRNGVSYTPYVSNERQVSSVTSIELDLLFKQRRSVRYFKESKVDIADIKEAVKMASQAPSACNRQPFKFYTVVDAAIAREVASISMGTAGFSHNINALIVVVGDLSAYFHERDRHLIYIDGGLVSMQLMLAFETLGLSSCPINWPDVDFYERKMSKRLKLEPYERPVMMMAVGVPLDDGKIPYSQKKSVDALIKVVE